MLHRLLVATCLVASIALSGLPLRADDAGDGDLARRATEILRRSCARCHKGQGSESGYAFDVLDIKSLAEDGVIEAGAPDSSSLLEAMREDRMPPRNRRQLLPRPSYDDIDVVRAWIRAGAPPPPPTEPRPRVTLADEISVVLEHLRAQPRDERANWRYFTLANLHNDPTVDSALVETARLALIKVLNSLSWKPDIVKGERLGPAGTVMAVKITALGWNRSHWNALAAAYPYALSFGDLVDQQPDKLDRELRELRGDRSPAILRADWMVARGTQPPLYYRILFDLSLPKLIARTAVEDDRSNPLGMTDTDLEDRLGVMVTANIAAGRVARSGFNHSGVSGQNRLVERHDLAGEGFYWKSYDFKSSNPRAILSAFPLGPRFNGNPFRDLAFDHDGGEIIFSLPNGLQGYLLVDGVGRRIDAGPIEVVDDVLKTSGNAQIVAGVSCMACHRQGMIEVSEDEIRTETAFGQEALKAVRDVYPEPARFSALVENDRRRFVAALEATLGPAPGGGLVADLPEPIGETARHYLLEPIRLETAAAELGVSSETLRAKIENDPNLAELGLRVLLREGGGLHRAAWESPTEQPLMKKAAIRLGYTPESFSASQGVFP